jgi:hypothetical protein
MLPLPTPIRRAALRAAAIAVTSACLALAAAAQTTPIARWSVRPDAGGARAEVRMADMKPGIHVTTGPAAILFDSTMRARGTWRLEATIHLFDPGARAEGFGVFFGGRDLGGPAPHYAYALVRRDGKALMKVREGATTRTVRDWAASAAIPVWKPGVPGTSVKYVLVVEASTDRVALWVGGTKVLDAPRSEVPTDGMVGLRINHALDLHIERVAVASVTLR